LCYPAVLAAQLTAA
jgi:predicted nuclease with TOPRIM domain